MKAQSLFAALSIAVALAGCSGGGGGEGGAPAVPASQNGLSTVNGTSATFAVNRGQSSVDLPVAGAVHGSLQLDVASAAANTHITVTTVDSGARAAASIGDASGYTAQLRVDAPVHLNGAPEFTIDTPVFSGLHAADLSYQVFDDSAATHQIASGTHADSITGSTAHIAVGLGTTDLDPTRTFAIVFSVHTHSLSASPAPGTAQFGMFAVPDQDAVLAIDLSQPGTTPQFHLIKGANTGIHAPVDIASGPSGEAVVLNQQQNDDPFGDVTTLRGNGVVFANNAQNNATPLSEFPASYAQLDHLTNGPAGIVYVYGAGDAGHQTEIDLVAGTNPAFGVNRPDIAGFRRFLSVNSAATAMDGQIAATVSDYGDFGGFTFSESSLSIAGNADFLLLSSNVPGDKEVQRNLPIYDYQFSPDDGKVYLLTGNGVNENCQTAPSKMLVFARGPFSLDVPERTIQFSSDMQYVQKIRFDHSGKLYALGVKNGGAVVVDVYASPAGSSNLTLLRSVSVDAQLKAYHTAGFAVQVVPATQLP